MNEENDINIQYEQVFGVKYRPNIFNPDDEEYASLRQEIIAAKRVFNINNKLPFDDIKLLQHKVLVKNENDNSEKIMAIYRLIISLLATFD